MKKKQYCCNTFEYFLNHKCDIHDNIFECPDHILCYIKKDNIYGIIIHDGGNSFIEISHCPWCGKKLN